MYYPMLLKICIRVVMVLLVCEDTASEKLEKYTIIGATVHLGCKRMSRNIQWTRNERPINNEGNINKDLKHRHRYSISIIKNSSTLNIYNTTASDQGKYICQGADIDGPFTEITYLCVLSMLVLPTTVVDEGTNVNICCFHNCYQECMNIVLEKDGAQLDRRSPLLKLQNISRNLSGNYSCSADSDQQAITSSTTITVQYPPNIQLIFNNVTNLLTCNVTSLPEPSVHLEHFSSYGQFVRVINTTRKQIFLNTFEDSGIYKCIAYNGIMSKDGLLNFSNSIYIELDGPPICVIHNYNSFYGQLNKNIQMSINIYCRPFCMDIYWKTSYGNSSAKQKTLPSNEEDVFVMTFHNVPVKVNGSISFLELEDLTGEDFRTYTVVAKNSVRTSYCLINLKEKEADSQIHALVWYILTCVVTSIGLLVLRFIYPYLEVERCLRKKGNKTDHVKTTKRQSRRSTRRNHESDSVFMEVIYNPLAPDQVFTLKNDSEDPQLNS